MSRVCANCGGIFSDEENHLVCPHCGADIDATYAEPPHEMSFDDPRMDDEAYAEFLREEGLAGKPQRRRGGCAVFLLLLLLPAIALLGLLAA